MAEVSSTEERPTVDASGAGRSGWTPALGLWATALLAVPALTTVWHMGTVLATHGPNTFGEAGKVFFARRFQVGESIFLPGDVPPYYPSVHGPLTHVLVGAVGKLLGLAPEDLYFAGRAVSLSATLLATWCCNGILARLGAGRGARLIALGVVLSCESVLPHAVSYRPDNWVLLLGALAARLLVMGPVAAPRAALLIGLPVLAFFVKPTALWLMGAIPLSLWLGGQRRLALVVGALSAGLLAASIGALQWVSAGAYLGSFRSGMGVPFDPVNYRVLMHTPHVTWLALLPALVLGIGRPLAGRDPERRVWVVLGCFWLASLTAGLATMLRSGSHLYYLLDACVYAAMLCVGWLADRLRRRGRGESRRLWPSIAAGTAFGLASLALWGYTLGQDARGFAVRDSERFGPYRQSLAAEINRAGHRAFSDDPGLNVLLDRPAVLYTMIPAMMLQSGSLSLDTLVRPIREHEYALIVLTGRRWRYRGIDDPPPELLDAIFRHYRPIPNETTYMFLVPRRDAAP